MAESKKINWLSDYLTAQKVIPLKKVDSISTLKINNSILVRNQLTFACCLCWFVPLNGWLHSYESWFIRICPPPKKVSFSWKKNAEILDKWVCKMVSSQCKQWGKESNALVRRKHSCTTRKATFYFKRTNRLQTRKKRGW